MVCDPSHTAFARRWFSFCVLLALRSTLVPLLSEVPLVFDLLLVLESFFSNVRPPTLVRGLVSCASCTDLFLAFLFFQISRIENFRSFEFL